MSRSSRHSHVDSAGESYKSSSYEAKEARKVPPLLNIPTRTHKSHVADDLELGIAQKTLTYLDYYEETRKKPIKILMTREISQYYGRETYLKTTIKEVFIFGLFIIVLSVLVFGTPATDMHMFTTSMTDIFIYHEFPVDGVNIRFKDINTLNHVWHFFNHTILQFHQDKFFPPAFDTESKVSGILENQLIGLPRIRSLRVTNDSCEVYKSFKDKNAHCYGSYSLDNEFTGAFGKMIGKEWNYTSLSELGMHTVHGLVSSYGGGGYYVDCPKDRDKFAAIMYKLMSSMWIDRATRAVTYDFIVYNANVNLFGIFKILFEMPTTGGVVPSLILHTLKIIDLGTSNPITVTCSLLFIVFFIFYTVEEIYEMTYFKWKFILSFWNFLDVGIILMSYLVITTFAFQSVTIKTILDSLQSNDSKFPNFDSMLYIQIVSNISFSLLIFFTWIKILKYVCVNHSMYQLHATLQLAVGDLCSYGVIFFWIFFHFALVGHCLFGSKIESYTTVIASAWTILRAGLGDFEFQEVVETRPYLGHLYFFLMVFFLGFIFAGMFVAIVLNSYSEIRSEVSTAPPQMKISDVLQNYLIDIVKTFSKKKAALVKEAFNRRKMHSKFQDVRYLLMRCGFTELEVNLFLAKYEISENRVMTEEDFENIMKNFNSKVPGISLARELVRQNVADKLTAMEDAVQNAEKKTAIVLRMLELFEARLNI